MSIFSVITSTVVRAALIGSLLLMGAACAPLDNPPSVVGASTSTNTASTTSTGTSASGAISNDGSSVIPGNSNAYTIGVGDNLSVNVWRNDDLSVTVPVRPDGKISVPLAGDIDVGGRTPEQVSGAITEKLAKYIRDPRLSP